MSLRIPEFLTHRKRWLIAASALPFFGVVAAFGTAPDTETHQIEQETVIEAIALPAATATDGGNFDFWREERIERGDSLASLLDRMGVNADEAGHVIAASRSTSGFARLSAGRNLLARVTSNGRLLTLRYMPDDERLASIERAGDGFHGKVETVALQSSLVMSTGKIRNSLFGATDSADIPDSIASMLAEIFAGDIDFHRDLRTGDAFSVVYETFHHAGAQIRTGRLLAAEFVNQGKTYRAVHFRSPNGRDAYYTPEGRSLRRAFLKSPIAFSRVSSGFSSARYHPVLKEWRAHRGIDYAAPTGTPIRAIADASVKFSGRQGGYGNLIILDHAGPYSTAYGHLSRFASGMRSGKRVKQGDIIGYVGATGLATGPHLHYEFRVDGAQKNPLALKLPTSQPLEPRYRNQFLASAAPLLRQLDLVSPRSLAAND
jgi:murein DD-endopeptidase MepM/ murein hydrolase activator NlpD